MVENFIVVYCTFPSNKDPKPMVSNILEKRLAACVNVCNEVNSTFMWESSICEEQELLLIMKTIENKFSDLVSEIETSHPYECPEIISLPITNVSNKYSKWLIDSISA